MRTPASFYLHSFSLFLFSDSFTLPFAGFLSFFMSVYLSHTQPYISVSILYTTTFADISLRKSERL